MKVDVRKPLKGGKKIITTNGAPITVRFTYEKLTLFCNLCGLLGHGDNNCEQLLLMDKDDGVRK